jgi:ferric-dicitrate binding protein FerR (iron transport regulator)
MPYRAVAALPHTCGAPLRNSRRTARRLLLLAAGASTAAGLAWLLRPAAVAAASWLGRLLLAALPSGVIGPGVFL